MKRRRAAYAHGEGEESEGNGERWLLTYADMITLLLALFILLFSMSTISQQRFQALALGLRQTFDPNAGVLQNGNGVLQNTSLTETAGNKASQLRTINQPVSRGTTASANPGAHSTTGSSNTNSAAEASGAAASSTAQPASAASQQQLVQIEQKVNTALAAKNLSGTVSTAVNPGELTIQILADRVFFATDSADLGAVGDQVVDTVASVLAQYPNLVDVDGYTDDQAITGGPFTSNEELSAVRAVNVVLRLSGVDGLSPSRLAATGFGDTHPAAPNDDAADMAKNRRIDIVVLGQGRTQS